MKLSKRTLILVTSLVLATSLSVFGTVAYLTSSQTVINTFTVGNVEIVLDETDVDKGGNPKFPVDTDGDGAPDVEVSVEEDGTIRVDPTPGTDSDPARDVVVNPGEEKEITLEDGTKVTVKQDANGNVVATESDKTPVTVDPEQAVPSRDSGNNYNLVPGKSYVKDPAVTVKADSEDCYVRMRVTLNNYADLKAITGAADADLLGKFVNVDAVNWILKTTEVADDAITYEFRYKEIVKSGSADEQLPALFTTFTVPGAFTREDLVKLQATTDQDALKMDVVADAIQSTAFENEDEAWTAFGVQYGN